MKTSYNWLKEYVNISWSPEKLAEELTMAGLEVEEIKYIGDDIPDTIIVAEILDRKPHSNADKLSICEVNSGESDNLQIVCGAPNCAPGKKVALAMVGTIFPNGDEIKKATIRGENSSGMLCSSSEPKSGFGS